MPKKKHLVDLSADEREELRQLMRRGNHASHKVTCAQILLLAFDGLTDEQIVAALKTGFVTVERTRKRFVEEGLGNLMARPRRGQARKLTGKQEAHLVAVAYSTHTTQRTRPVDTLIVGRQSRGVEVRFIYRPRNYETGAQKTHSSRD